MESTNIIYLILAFVLPIMGIYLYYIRLYRHPVLIKLSTNPSMLFTVPIEKLQETKRLLNRTYQLQLILTENNIPQHWLEKAIDFVDMSPLERCRLLCHRLSAQFESTESNEVFKIRLGSNFPLNLINFIVYFPDNQMTIADIQLKLDFLRMYMQDVIIITIHHENQLLLRPLAENRATPWIVPNSRELTTLLLHPKPINIFVSLLSKQLTITRLSPYVTAGANTKFFFGRETILAQIIQYPSNYFVVGGRQLGKSSLLKQVENYYQSQQKTKCYYFSLFNTKLANALGEFIGLDAETSKSMSLSTLLNRLAINDGKRYLFLIDEADEFIREEVTLGYPNLSYFRGLSEQGMCHFIFAGFWELYAATLNYRSPIRNFGKVLHIKELEYSACKQLAKKPMEMFRIRYASEQLVEMILQQTGQRANLIALTCDKLLKNLGNDEYVFSEQSVYSALRSKEIAESLGGWASGLTADKQATSLDRIVVFFATVQKGKFTQAGIMKFLDKYHYVYIPEQLRQSLERLELAFIIEKKGNHYTFCVPLFRELLISQGKEMLIRSLREEMFLKFKK